MIREAARLPEVASELSTSRPLPVGPGVVQGQPLCRFSVVRFHCCGCGCPVSYLPQMFLCPWGEGRGLKPRFGPREPTAYISKLSACPETGFKVNQKELGLRRQARFCYFHLCCLWPVTGPRHASVPSSVRGDAVYLSAFWGRLEVS